MFGGQVAGQALVAAGRTVDPTGTCTRCTRTSCGPATRASRSSTTSTASATAAASRPAASSRSSTAGRSSTCRRRSTSHEPGPEHQYPMPDAPDPESLPTIRERLEPYADRFPPDVRRLDPARPPDRHAFGASCRAGSIPSRATREPEQLVWFRADGKLPDDPLLHACVVAYASDLTLLDTAVMAHARLVGRRPVHDREPRPRDVVPPAAQGRRVAAVPPEEPVGAGRARARRRASSSATTARSRSR